MKMLYQEWIESGKRKAEFASEKGIVRTTFYYWVSKFCKQETQSVSKGGFSLLAVGGDSSRPVCRPVACIKYPSGLLVELYEGVTADFIRKLTC